MSKTNFNPAHRFVDTLLPLDAKGTRRWIKVSAESSNKPWYHPCLKARVVASWAFLNIMTNIVTYGGSGFVNSIAQLNRGEGFTKAFETFGREELNAAKCALLTITGLFFLTIALIPGCAGILSLLQGLPPGEILEDLEDQKAKLEVALKEKAEEIEELKAQKEELETKLKRVEKERNENSTSARIREEELQKEIKDLKLRLEKAKGKQEASEEQDGSEIEQRFIELEKNYSSKELELEIEKGVVEQTQKQRVELVQQVEELKEQINERDERITQLEKELVGTNEEKKKFHLINILQQIVNKNPDQEEIKEKLKLTEAELRALCPLTEKEIEAVSQHKKENREFIEKLASSTETLQGIELVNGQFRATSSRSHLDVRILDALQELMEEQRVEHRNQEDACHKKLVELESKKVDGSFNLDELGEIANFDRFSRFAQGALKILEIPLLKLSNSELQPLLAEYQQRIVDLKEASQRLDTKNLLSTSEIVFPKLEQIDPVLNSIQLLVSGKELNASHVFEKQMVFDTLKRLYGEDAANDVLIFYQLEKQNYVKAKDLRALLIGIQANLTIDALTNLYNLRKDDKVCEIYPCLTKYAEEERSLVEFTDKELFDFLQLIRNPQGDTDEANKAFVVASDEWIKESQIEPYTYQLHKDLNFIKACSRWQEYVPLENDSSKIKELKNRFGYSEFISRDIGYGIFYSPGGAAYSQKSRFSKKTLFGMYDPSRNGVVCQQIFPHVRRFGLLGVNILPVIATYQPVTIRTVFRGTNDYESLRRDFGPRAFFGMLGKNIIELMKWKRMKGIVPGHHGFNTPKAHQEMAESYQEVWNEAQKLSLSQSKEIQAEVMGHSLGASDAQRWVVEILKMVGEEKIDSTILKRISLLPWNAPGIHEDTEKDFVKICRELSNRLPEIHFNYFKVEGDLVQTAGHRYLGETFSQYDQRLDKVLLAILIFDRPKEELWKLGWLGPHIVPILSHSYLDEDKKLSGDNNPTQLKDIRANDPELIELLQKILKDIECYIQNGQVEKPEYDRLHTAYTSINCPARVRITQPVSVK